VIAYVRVSTKSQAEGGDGLDLQLEKIRAYAEARGFRIIKVYRETHSGVGTDSIADRTELQKALARARKTNESILVASTDRVGRDEKTVTELLNCSDAVIISVENGEGADQAVLAAQARSAEQTARIISRTTKEALKSRKKQGVPLGNRTNLGEAQILGAESNRHRFRSRVDEYLTILQEVDPKRSKTRKQIVEILNERGFRTDRGIAWTAGNFRRLHEEIDRRRERTAPEPPDKSDWSFEERQKDDPLWGKFA
jgi:DNA invertase Pin-like site-specific DNA recombinase